MRQLGSSRIHVTPLAMGCWPISGITSPDATEADALATLQAACDGGINFFDTAYCYGYDGESEKLIARALQGRREGVVIATKGGLEWGPDRKIIKDASPATLRRQCEASLRRLQTDHVDLLYLHAPDPSIPIAESAAALRRLLEEGKTRSVGVSNVSRVQLEEFAGACPLAAYQPYYNMLQRDIETEQLPWCVENNVAVVVYWPLLKGLLAGKLGRDHLFPEGDGRKKYPMFQGEEWQRNLDFVDELRPVAVAAGKSVSQLVLNWTIHQPGITAALAGAKRPEQMIENTGAIGWRLTPEQLSRIEIALRRRGLIQSRSPV